jgi:pimeloyl-ACP methyl ester carboxylesterase
MSRQYERVTVDEKVDGDDRAKKYFLGCFAVTVVVVLVIVFLGVPIYGGYELTRKHRSWAEDIYANCEGYPETFCTSGDWLTPKNMTRYLAWNGCSQGYKNNSELAKCGSPCFAPRLVENTDDFNKAHDFKLVSFPSRKAPDGQKHVTLKAWWLPSGKDNAPTVVLQHGNNANFNSRNVVLSAYLLRSLGIDVLMHSLRDHGMSGNSTGKVTWGWEYVFDLLGAWDYAVKDPDGHLGGSKDPTKVGIMGMSMGGFIVNTAFGMEHRIPGVWSDGAVFSVTGFMTETFAPYAGPLAPIIGSLATWWGGIITGADIQKYEPSNTLPTGPSTKRKVAVVTSALDTFVPAADSLKMADLVKTMTDKYELVLSWAPESDCNGNAHCSVALAMPDKYRQKLYDFWSSVFGLEQDASLMSSLPELSRPSPDQKREKRHESVKSVNETKEETETVKSVNETKEETQRRLYLVV